MKPNVMWTLIVGLLLAPVTLGCSPSMPIGEPQPPNLDDSAPSPTPQEASQDESLPARETGALDQEQEAAGTEANKLAEVVSMTTIASEQSPTLTQVQDGIYEFTVRLENTGDDAIILWPFLSIKIVNSDGEEVPKATKIGRWGLIRSPSILEEIAFVTLDAGQTHDITVNLKNYTSGPDFIAGWQLTQAGQYDLLVSYEFDREVAKEKYGKGCADIDGTDKPWNQAVELKRTEKVRLAVQ